MFVLHLLTTVLAFGDQAKIAESPADAWPSFRGNVSMTGRAGSELPEKLELIWKQKVGEAIDGGAVIADGLVYVGTNKGSMYCLSFADGKEVWKFQCPVEDGNYRPGIPASPTVAGDLLVFGDESGTVWALNRKDGKQKWQFKTEGPIHSSPTFADNRIIIGSDDFQIYCFDKDGKKLWSAETGERVFCSPAPVNGNIVTASCDGQARLISIADGMEVKAVPLDDAVASTPAVVGDRLYVGTMGDGIICLDVTKMEVAWRKTVPNAGKYFASPAVTQDLVVLGCRQRRVIAINRETGETVWSFSCKGSVDSSPVTVGDRVFFGSDDGRFYGLDLKTGTKVFQHICGERVAATPAVASKRIVIGDGDGNVYCFGSKG